MCTVSHIPTKEGFFLTSYRDEKTGRKQAFAQAGYHNDSILVYTKDGATGSTWIAVRENSNTGVLLNGAFKKHTPAPPYRKSRGLILIEIMTSEKPYPYFLQLNLEEIGPFTLVLYSNNNLYEWIWGSSSKNHKILNKQLPQIWSSNTLYEDIVIKKRQDWFASCQIKNTNATQDAIRQFAGDGDYENNIMMNRNNFLRTISISGIEGTNEKAMVRYSDLLTPEYSELTISFAALKQLHGV